MRMRRSRHVTAGIGERGDALRLAIAHETDLPRPRVVLRTIQQHGDGLTEFMRSWMAMAFRYGWR